MIDPVRELTLRANETGLHEHLLKAVYLRGMRERGCGGDGARSEALYRVDRFIRYATVRDTSCAQDRDMADFVTVP